jgi:hypothetical protein
VVSICVDDSPTVRELRERCPIIALTEALA